MEKYFFLTVLLSLVFLINGCQKKSFSSRVYKDAPQSHAPLKIVTRKATKRGLFSSNKDKNKNYHKDSPNNGNKSEKKNTIDSRKEKKND